MLIKHSCMTYQASHQPLCGMGLIRSILLKKLRQSYKTCVISHCHQSPQERSQMLPVPISKGCGWTWADRRGCRKEVVWDLRDELWLTFQREWISEEIEGQGCGCSVWGKVNRERREERCCLDLILVDLEYDLYQSCPTQRWGDYCGPSKGP